VCALLLLLYLVMSPHSSFSVFGFLLIGARCTSPSLWITVLISLNFPEPAARVNHTSPSLRFTVFISLNIPVSAAQVNHVRHHHHHQRVIYTIIKKIKINFLRVFCPQETLSYLWIKYTLCTLFTVRATIYRVQQRAHRCCKKWTERRKIVFLV
jgi:hypothetical protein